MKKIVIASLTAVIMAFMGGCSGSDSSGGSPGSNNDGGKVSTVVSWIDTHTHPLGYETNCTTSDCMGTSVALMDQYGVRKAILMSPPSVAVSEGNEELVRKTVAFYPSRFFYGGGGSTLNPLIQKGPDTGPASAELLQQLETGFQRLVDTGEVVAFGETAALHLSYSPSHPYEETPADSDLFLKLADLAAQTGVPLDIHMDIVETDTPTPTFFTGLSNLNPTTLKENVTAFEQLLGHNPSAKIVLAHVGRDTTGQMTADLIGRLMSAHPNLYLQIHPVFGPLKSGNAIVDQSGGIGSQWLDLVKQYADRIVLGSDEFFSGESETNSLDDIQKFLQQLPQDIAQKIGCTNPVRIYNLPSGC